MRARMIVVATITASLVSLAAVTQAQQRKMTVEELLAPYNAQTKEPSPEAQPAQPTGPDWKRLLDPNDMTADTQRLRLLILFSYSAKGVIDRHESPIDGEVRLFVRPEFRRLANIEKEQVAALAFVYHWGSDPGIKVVIRETGSGRRLGQFSLPGMLRLDH
jgi:hypothetical protein